jgi:UrcA family protein
MNSNVQTTNRACRAYCTAMLLACVLVISNAFADEQVRTETVKFADLNVNSQAGVEALFGRIHSAAKHVCSETDPLQRVAASACIWRAEARAIEKLNLPLLTVYYRMKNGGRTEVFTANR